MAVSLGELAVRFGCELRGDPQERIEAVGTLDGGGPGTIGFVANPQYRERLRATRVSAVILDEKLASECPVAVLVAGNPHAVFARVATLLHPLPVVAPGVHPSAIVSSDARVHPSAHVGAYAVIEAGASIGERALIGPHCIVGEGAQIAADVRLLARAIVGARVVLGARTLVHAGAVIGSDGFGYAREGATWIKVPQLGSVRVGEDAEIGANTTIDRGALDDTVIEDGVKLDNQIQVGHNVRIGAHTAIAACTGIAGSATIGRRCMIGGGTGIGQITLGDDIVITGFGMVTRSIDKPGLYSSVFPVEEARNWRRLVGRFKRLESMAARVKALERTAGIKDESGEQDD